MAPSGASRGKFEARELRDGFQEVYGGLSVQKAVRNVQEILAPALQGREAAVQREIDNCLVGLDDSPDFRHLGANAVLATSLACAQAAAAAARIPLYAHLGEERHWHLPLPMVNIVSGGLHAGSNLTAQDFMVIPYGAECFSKALEWVWAIREAVLALLQSEKNYTRLIADEGGFGPDVESNHEVLEVLVRAIDKAGYRPEQDVGIAIDVAASHLLRRDGYALEARRSSLSSAQMVEEFEEWQKAFPIISLEDPLGEEDWEGWKSLTARLGDRLQLIGDDLFVTNPTRLARGMDKVVANAILIKPNQIGTLTGALEVIQQAQEAGYGCIVSARSGETEDTTIADLAVATGVGQIKIGSLARSSRLAKYNQLLRIEEQIGRERFAGRSPLHRFLAGKKA